MKRHFGRIVPFLLAVLLICSASCGKQQPSETEAPAETAKPAATPSAGIGREEPPEAEPKEFTICIDPGHGFKDGGCAEGVYPDGTLEKDITMAVAVKLKAALEERGFKTMLTHDGVNKPEAALYDNLYSAQERIPDVNAAAPDYFISLHVDIYDEDPTISGIRVYYIQSSYKTSTLSGPFAELIVNAIAEESLDGSKPQLVNMEYSGYSYAVIRETTMPACLIEMGFASNETDRENLVDEVWQNAFVRGVAKGISACFESISEPEDSNQ